MSLFHILYEHFKRYAAVHSHTAFFGNWFLSLYLSARFSPGLSCSHIQIIPAEEKQHQWLFISIPWTCQLTTLCVRALENTWQPPPPLVQVCGSPCARTRPPSPWACARCPCSRPGWLRGWRSPCSSARATRTKWGDVHVACWVVGEQGWHHGRHAPFLLSEASGRSIRCTRSRLSVRGGRGSCIFMYFIIIQNVQDRERAHNEVSDIPCWRSWDWSTKFPLVRWS